MDTQKVCEGRPERPDPTLRIAALKGSMESRTDAVCTACTPQPGQRAWSLDSGVVNDMMLKNGVVQTRAPETFKTPRVYQS